MRLAHHHKSETIFLINLTKFSKMNIEVNYRINDGDTRTIEISRSATVEEFLNEVRGLMDDPELIDVNLYGRRLDPDDLIINFSNDIHTDVFEILRSERIIEQLPDTTSDEDTSIPDKASLKYKIYTTATERSFLSGDFIQLYANYTYQDVQNEIEKLIKGFEVPNIPENFETHIFFPGGIYFSPSDGDIESNLENFLNLQNDMSLVLYVVVTKPLGDFIDEKVEGPFDILKFNKNMLSPLFESTTAGLTQIASLLNYIYYNGINAYRLIEIFANSSRFSPLVVNLFRLLGHFELNVLNIIAITGPLFAYLNTVLRFVEHEEVFEYTMTILTYIGLIEETKKIDYLLFDLNETEKTVTSENDEDEKFEFKFFNYLKSFDNQQHVLVWKTNTTKNLFGFNIDVGDAYILLDREIFNNIYSYKPIPPLSLSESYYPTFVQGQDEQDVFLFINRDSDDENFVYCFDPKVGKVERSSIESLSIKYNNDMREPFMCTTDPFLIDQIVIICFDLSSSMNLNPKGEKVNEGEMSRFQLSKEFLRLFIDESKKLKNSSVYGLVSFGGEVKVNIPITAISSEFLDGLGEVNQIDDKKLLLDAISRASLLIHDINVENDDDDDDYDDDPFMTFNKAAFRVIVISDGNDNKSSITDTTLINFLIKDKIALDTIFVSEKITDKNFLYAASKLTGGACFQLTNSKDGMNIIEQEAFINMKYRIVDKLECRRIDDKILANKASNFDAFDVELGNKKSDQSKNLNSLSKPESIIHKYKNKFNSYQCFLALKELRYVVSNPSPNFVVYSSFSKPFEWHIFIKGLNETPFENKWLALYMILSSKFPQVPPSFTFMAPPFHPNVARDGRVSFSMIEKDYKIGLPIAAMIEEIIKILKTPDVNCVINHHAYELFNSNKVEFEKLQNDFVSFQLDTIKEDDNEDDIEEDNEDIIQDGNKDDDEDGFEVDD